MTDEEAHQILDIINRSIKYETVKIENKFGYWQEDQIVKWKKLRWKHIKRKQKFLDEHPEFFL